MADDESERTRRVIIPFPAVTPQERGRKYERQRAKEQGLRTHPSSGAGPIKHDASDDDRLLEYKTAQKSFTLNGKYLLDFFKVAVRQGKEPILEIHFPKYGLTLTTTIRRTRTND